MTTTCVSSGVRTLPSQSQATAGQVGWFALYVKTGKEREVAGMLAEKGFESYLPVRRHDANGADRRRAPVALFSSYCFCRLDVSDRSSMVVTTPFVYGFVTCASKRVEVPDDDIEGIRRVEQTGVPVEVISSQETFGAERIALICGGPFRGLHGRVMQQRGRARFAIEIQAVQQCLVVEVESRWLQVCN